METLSDGDDIIKQDHLGQVLATKDQRTAMMVEFERSGMSGAAFARLVGVKYSTFAHWVKQWRKHKQDDSGEVTPVRWLEAEIKTGPSEPPPERLAKGSSTGLLVELSGGSRLWVETAMQVHLAAELIRLMDEARRARC